MFYVLVIQMFLVLILTKRSFRSFCFPIKCFFKEKYIRHLVHYVFLIIFVVSKNKVLATKSDDKDLRLQTLNKNRINKKQNNMNKSIRLIIVLGLVMIAASACKTKQKVAQIPAGANVEATAPVAVVTPPVVNYPAASETEVTRNENFSLADGETNTDAMKFKYHVVVGSFKNQANAKGLQSTLNAEGNRAVIVVNQQAMFRVLIASFNDYNQAKARIKEIATRFPDAWVLVQK